MVKRIFTRFAVAVLAFAGIAALPVATAEAAWQDISADGQKNGLYVEQVQARMPVLKVWFHPDTSAPEESNVSAAMGGTVLELVDLRKVPEQDETQFFFLVDCSTSISSSQIKAVKAALDDFASHMPSGARVTLIGFGKQVQLLLEQEQDKQAIKEAVAAIQANQSGTLLFDALAKAAELAGQEEYALQRKMLFLFSDSIDYNLGGYTKEEVSGLLDAAGLPLFAMGFDTGRKAALDNLGALARSSGGGISIVNGKNLGEKLGLILDNISNAWEATFTAATNRIAAVKAPFSLTVADTTVQTLAPQNYWTPDSQAPSILSAMQKRGDSLEIVFSEPVEGAANVQSYTLQTPNGSLLGISAAAYEEDAHTATLTLSQIPGSTQVTIAFPGILDRSMEENRVEGTVAVQFQGSVQEGSPPAPEVPLEPDPGIPASAWVALALAGAGILTAIILGVTKKRIKTVAQLEAVRANGSQSPAANEVLVHGDPGQVHFVQGELPIVRLEVRGAAGHAKQVEIPINGTLFIGRSDICNVVFDDPRMSRQHVVIEEKNGRYTIANLSESGGTLLNGIPIQSPRPLRDDDVIEAGQERIVFLGGKAGTAQ